MQQAMRTEATSWIQDPCPSDRLEPRHSGRPLLGNTLFVLFDSLLWTFLKISQHLQRLIQLLARFRLRQSRVP